MSLLHFLQNSQAVSFSLTQGHRSVSMASSATHESGHFYFVQSGHSHFAATWVGTSWGTSLCKGHEKRTRRKRTGANPIFWLKTNMHTNREFESQNVHFDLIQDTEKQRYLVLRFIVAAGGSYVWRSLKNRVRVLTGRTTYFDEHGLFLRQYVLHVTRLRPLRKITCTGLKSEGAGSQALMVMNAINFARSFGLTYVHSPFTLIHHAERPTEEWVTSWETLFNLGDGEPVCDIE